MDDSSTAVERLRDFANAAEAVSYGENRVFALAHGGKIHELNLQDIKFVLELVEANPTSHHSA